MRSPAFTRRSYAVLATLSRSYPPSMGTFRCITHPFATRRQGCPRAAVRLACVRHAASVQSEPGSNSTVQSNFAPAPHSPTHCVSAPRELLQHRKPTHQNHGFLRTLNERPTSLVASKSQTPTLIGCFLLRIVLLRAFDFRAFGFRLPSSGRLSSAGCCSSSSEGEILARPRIPCKSPRRRFRCGARLRLNRAAQGPARRACAPAR